MAYSNLVKISGISDFINFHLYKYINLVYTKCILIRNPAKLYFKVLPFEDTKLTIYSGIGIIISDNE